MMMEQTIGIITVSGWTEKRLTFFITGGANISLEMCGNINYFNESNLGASYSYFASCLFMTGPINKLFIFIHSQLLRISTVVQGERLG